MNIPTKVLRSTFITYEAYFHHQQLAKRFYKTTKAKKSSKFAGDEKTGGFEFESHIPQIEKNSFKEDLMIEFLSNYLSDKGYNYDVDEFGNVYVTKGTLNEGEFYPCVVAHTDTVHKIDTINIREEIGRAHV